MTNTPASTSTAQQDATDTPQASVPVCADDVLAGQVHSRVTATTQQILRVWDDSPHMTTVPARDANNRLIEFVFLCDRNATFHECCASAITDAPVEVTATGFWKRRNWRKRTGSWGYTWQFIVASWSLDAQPGSAYGYDPVGMLAPADVSVTEPQDA